jgi:hypothetical protein
MALRADGADALQMAGRQWASILFVAAMQPRAPDRGGWTRLGYRILQRTRVFHPRGCVQNFDTDNVPFFVIVQDDPGFIFIALFNERAAEANSQDVDFLIVFHFHASPQYFLILLVR